MTNHIDLRKFFKKSKKVIIQWSKEIVFIYGGRTGNTYEQGKKKKFLYQKFFVYSLITLG